MLANPAHEEHGLIAGWEACGTALRRRNGKLKSIVTTIDEVPILVMDKGYLALDSFFQIAHIQ